MFQTFMNHFNLVSNILFILNRLITCIILLCQIRKERHGKIDWFPLGGRAAKRKDNAHSLTMIPRVVPLSTFLFFSFFSLH